MAGVRVGSPVLISFPFGKYISQPPLLLGYQLGSPIKDDHVTWSTEGCGGHLLAVSSGRQTHRNMTVRWQPLCDHYPSLSLT